MDDLKKALLETPEVTLQAVAVPAAEWGLPLLYIAEFDAHERDGFEEAWQEHNESRDNANFKMFTVIYFLCNKDRQLLFTPDEYDKMAPVFKKRKSKVLARLFNVACRVNGLTKADLDTVEKNSEATGESAGSSGSPLASDTQAEEHSSEA